VEDETFKRPRVPRWWLNTYFIFAFLLAIIGLLGLIMGSDYIRDPGQSSASALPFSYLLAAAVFVINGVVSHRSSIRAYNEENDA
jgi:H+/Cl- antiporter ClcA